MKCPYCNVKRAEVIDSRPSPDRTMRRRRYRCSRNHRFSTLEALEASEVWTAHKRLAELRAQLTPLAGVMKLLGRSGK